MVDYPDLSNLNNQSGIGGLLSLPNASYPYFWAWILGGIWFILTLSLYFSDKEKIGKGQILSAMSISCFAIILLSAIGTIVGFVSVDIIIYILVISLIIIAVWWYSVR